MNNKLLFFEKMITPKIFTIIYWIMLVSVLVFGFNTIFSGYEGFTTAKFFLGLSYMAGGAIAIRVWCELIIDTFKINENF